MAMNIVDIIIITVICVFAYKNYKKGFTEVVFGLLAILAGLYLAFSYYPLLSEKTKSFLENNTLREVLSFALIFISVNFLVHWVGDFIKKLLEKLYLGWLNRGLGMAVGMAKGFLIMGLIVLGLTSVIGQMKDLPFAKEQTRIAEDQMKTSLVTPYMLKGIDYVFNEASDAIPKDMKDKGKEIISEWAQ